METKQVSLVNDNTGCQFNGELSDTQLQYLLGKGWRVAEFKDKKMVVANLVRFGV